MNLCWRYRVRDYRVIREIWEEAGVVLVLTIKHRSVAYD
jgi:mRNA-degrading endonuclease RelE of RelBE toxin-antitoxin system